MLDTQTALMSKNNDIYITRPYLPPLEEFIPYLEDIWSSGQVTNQGTYHQRFEEELSRYLRIPCVSLFSNCTTALLVALRALGISGDVMLIFK